MTATQVATTVRRHLAKHGKGRGYRKYARPLDASQNHVGSGDNYPLTEVVSRIAKEGHRYVDVYVYDSTGEYLYGNVVVDLHTDRSWAE